MKIAFVVASLIVAIILMSAAASWLVTKFMPEPPEPAEMSAGAKGPIEAGPMSRYTRVAPCPFCGSDVEADRDDMTGLVTVGCDRPGCCILDTSYGNEAEAIAAWNRRVPTEPGREPEEGL